MKSLYLFFFLVCFFYLNNIVVTTNIWVSYPIKDTNSTVIDFVIALKQQRVTDLENRVLEISNPKSQSYGQWLTVEEIGQYVNPSKIQVRPVFLWLKNHDILPFCNHLGDVIVCHRVPVFRVNKLLQVEMRYHVNKKVNKKVIRADRNYVIPKSLRNIIVFVDGISNALPHLHKFKQTNINTVDSGAVTRQVIKRLYHIPHDADSVLHNITSIGVIEFTSGEGFSQTDLAMSQIGNGIEKNPVTTNHIIGSDSHYPDVESELDIQFVSQVAANADLWYWDTSVWLYQFAVRFFNTPQVPQVISLSWGWNEADQCYIINCDNKTSQQYVQRVNVELMKITARGITICVASGDAGASGRTDETCDIKHAINPVFPGSSPWVTSVSATFLADDDDDDDNNHSIQTFTNNTPVCQQLHCAQGSVEYPTNYDNTSWTTGGGFDNYNSRPVWQQFAVDQYLAQENNIAFPNKTLWNAQGRGYPDVSALGHNCAVYFGQQDGWGMVDGTSCSSPLFAGIIALLNDHQSRHSRPTLGFLNPLLYQMAIDEPSIFNDITNGNNHCTELECCSSNFGFQATTGWDAVSGLGTPRHVDKMIHYLDQLYEQ